MSKEYIEACMKRYGKKETYKCRKISYKKYQNWKSANTNEHFEYLFYIEKKDKKDIIYESPLNYIGSKFKIVGEMKKYLPEKINHFVDISDNFSLFWYDFRPAVFAFSITEETFIWQRDVTILHTFLHSPTDIF